MNSCNLGFKALTGHTAGTPRSHHPVKYQKKLTTSIQMSRSIKKSIAIPQPIREGILSHVQSGVIGYPSEKAAWIGLARYQLLIGKPHPVTAAIALMHQNHQDIIDDFLHALAVRKIGLRGQFLSRLISQAIEGNCNPTEQEVEGLIPQELLRMAREWKRHPDQVLQRLTES